MMRFDGALARSGVSIIWVNSNRLPWRLPTPTTPYVHAIGRHLLDRDDVRIVGQAARGIDHLRQAAALVLHQHVGQQRRERLVSDQLARAPDRVTEAERKLLAREAGGARSRQVAGERFEIVVALALGERVLELELAVEVVLDYTLVAAGDEDEMLDAGLARLVDHVLDQRPVDHRQHLLRHGLGRGQESGAQSGHGENGFADRSHVGAGTLMGTRIWERGLRPNQSRYCRSLGVS